MYYVIWANGEDEYCERTIENYSVLHYLKKQGEVFGFWVQEDAKAGTIVNSEIEVIKNALKATRNQREAATILGVSPPTVCRKIKKYKLKENSNGSNFNGIH